MALKSKFVERAGAPPELVASWRLGVGRAAPARPLDLELLLDGGALSGPMFEPRPGPLGWLWSRLRRRPHVDMLGLKPKETKSDG